ncbi:AAA family ATPase [Natronorubrum sp. JWXQ-INN-674]|uniref:AAA family ATPase n=1 Tax=Natronorubrum halalkaliphilum TaxID=2691917 RepID=A0A6B0VNF7_9EURY|nr:AAA family ATPase [Natronorubrum halalkaliphilum]MXV62099.1 AAA family ATPase [Natronorubrum halalkaliphilum]
MIADIWVFDDDYQTDILHRNEELNSLSRLLEPATRGERADDVLIHGPSGVGKTATARWMLRDLRKRAAVSSALVECSGETANGIIHEAVEKHPTGTVVQRNSPRDELVSVLEEIVDEPFIIVLDEADVIPDLDVLDDLLSVELLSVIAITHSETEWLSRVEREIRPCFRGDSQINYRKYHVPELVDILEPRVEHGLIGDPVREGQLEWIADETGGVARWAIKSVLAAAELAEERRHEYFHEADVRDAFSRAKMKIRKDNLLSLPVPYQRLYELVRRAGPASGGEMKDAYLEHQEAIFDGRSKDPVSWRQACNYLSKMEDYDLIRMPGETNAKVYEAVDSELEAPVEFELRQTAELD